LGYFASTAVCRQDGRTLFAACGGINTVAQIEAETGTIEGLIPSGWYVNSLAISADGGQLAAGSLLAWGRAGATTRQKRFVHAYGGSVAVLRIPGKSQLASYITAVMENNHVPIQAASRWAKRRARGAGDSQTLDGTHEAQIG
jgi:hypothetical protein